MLYMLLSSLLITYCEGRPLLTHLLILSLENVSTNLYWSFLFYLEWYENWKLTIFFSATSLVQTETFSAYTSCRFQPLNCNYQAVQCPYSLSERLWCIKYENSLIHMLQCVNFFCIMCIYIHVDEIMFSSLPSVMWVRICVCRCLHRTNTMCRFLMSSSGWLYKSSSAYDKIRKAGGQNYI